MAFDKNKDAILINSQGSTIRALDDQIIYRDTINRFGSVATQVSIDYNWDNDLVTLNGYFIVEGFFIHFNNYKGPLLKGTADHNNPGWRLDIANGVYRDILNRSEEPWIGEQMMIINYPDNWQNGHDTRSLKMVNDTDYTPQYKCPLFYCDLDNSNKKITIHANWSNAKNETITTSGDINGAFYIDKTYQTNNIPDVSVRINEQTLLNPNLDNETKFYKKQVVNPFDDSTEENKDKSIIYHQFLHQAFNYDIGHFTGFQNSEYSNVFENYRNPMNGEDKDTHAHNNLNVTLFATDINGTKHALKQFNVAMQGLMDHMGKPVHYAFPVIYGDNQPLMFFDLIFQAVDDTANDKQINFKFTFDHLKQRFTDNPNFNDATKVNFTVEGEWI